MIQHSADDGDFSYRDWTAPYRTPAGRDAMLAAYCVELTLTREADCQVDSRPGGRGRSLPRRDGDATAEQEEDEDCHTALRKGSHVGGCYHGPVLLG